MVSVAAHTDVGIVKLWLVRVAGLLIYPDDGPVGIAGFGGEKD